MKWQMLLLCILAPALLFGCTHVTRTIVEHKPDDNTASTRAPWKGEYQLWEVRSPGNEHQIQSCLLNEKQPIGFDCSDGKLVAVAGTNRYALAPGWYSWQRAVSQGEIAAETGAIILILPFMVGAAMGGGP